MRPLRVNSVKLYIFQKIVAIWSSLSLTEVTPVVQLFQVQKLFFICIFFKVKGRDIFVENFGVSVDETI